MRIFLSSFEEQQQGFRGFMTLMRHDRGRRGHAGLQRPARNVSLVEASWFRCCAAAPRSRTRPPSPFRLAQKNEDGRAGAKACGIAEIGQGLMCRIVDGRATQK